MDSDEETIATDELQPRVSLRPTPAPFYNAPFKSSVPEVSLIFNNSPRGAATPTVLPTAENNEKQTERQASEESESYNTWKFKNLRGSQMNQNSTLNAENPFPKFKYYSTSPSYTGNNRIGLSDRNEINPRTQTPWAPSESTYNNHNHYGLPTNNEYFSQGLKPTDNRMINKSLPNGTRYYPNESPILEQRPISPRNYRSNTSSGQQSAPHVNSPPYGQHVSGYESGEPMPLQCDQQNVDKNCPRSGYNPNDFQNINYRLETNQPLRNIPQPVQNNPNSWSTTYPRQHFDHMTNVVPMSGHVNLSPHDVYHHSNLSTESQYATPTSSYNDRDTSARNNQSATRVQNGTNRSRESRDGSRDLGIRNSAKKTTASAVSDLCRVVQLQNEQLQILQAQVAQLLSRQLTQDHRNAIEYPEEARRIANTTATHRKIEEVSNKSRNTFIPSETNTNHLVTKVQNLNERQDRAENGDQNPNDSFAWDKSLNFSIVDETSPHGEANGPNNYGGIVQKMSIGVMTSFVDQTYFNNTGVNPGRHGLGRPNELLRHVARQRGTELGARPKVYKNQACQSDERDSRQANADRPIDVNETRPKDVLPSLLNDYRGNETRLNDLVGFETRPKELWTPPAMNAETQARDVNRGSHKDDNRSQPSSNLNNDLLKSAAVPASRAGHNGLAAPPSNTRLRQSAEQTAGSPFDMTRSTPGTGYVDESITLNGLDYPGPVEHEPSPASSIHVDIQDYRSSDDDGRDEESPTPFETAGDNRATTSPVEEGERIGWTFYNNVVGQVNEILQAHPSRRRFDSDCSEDRTRQNDAAEQDARLRQQNASRNGNQQRNDTCGEPRPAQRHHDGGALPSNVETVRNATLEHLRALGVSSYDPDGANGAATKKVTFDSVYYNCPRMDFVRLNQEAKESSDISLRMNALAMKYLKDDQISEYVRLSTGNNVQDVAVYNVATKKTNHSFATMRYLERYQLIPAARDPRRDQPTNVENQGRVPIRQEPIPNRSADGNNSWGNHYQYNQPKAPNKILDITALKQQPKFI